MALGSSNAEEIKVSWLFPSRSDTDILLYVVSVQYNWDVLHWTANPSQTPILVITVVVFSSSIRSRLMFSSVTSLQNMKPRLKWTSIATALVRPRITEFTFAFPWSTATISVVFDTNRHGGVQIIAMNRKIRSRKSGDRLLIILSLAALVGRQYQTNPVLWLDSVSPDWAHLSRSGLSPFIPCKMNIVWSSMERTYKVRNFRKLLAMEMQKAKSHKRHCYKQSWLFGQQNEWKGNFWTQISVKMITKCHVLILMQAISEAQFMIHSIE